MCNIVEFKIQNWQSKSVWDFVWATPTEDMKSCRRGVAAFSRFEKKGMSGMIRSNKTNKVYIFTTTDYIYIYCFIPSGPPRFSLPLTLPFFLYLLYCLGDFE